ncbi:hypothetical protein N7504_006277 [Penicillium tannophilum]|nr:hypothetical protein N7504_006277 [Penicillium tannophilum]
MVNGSHGSSSALHKNVLRVRHHRVAASQQLRHADQIHPDAWRKVHILQHQGLVELPPERELHRTNPFGFHWIARRVQHLAVGPQTAEAAPVPADVASGGGVQDPPGLRCVGIKGRHPRPHDIDPRSLGSRRALPIFHLA